MHFACLKLSILPFKCDSRDIPMSLECPLKNSLFTVSIKLQYYDVYMSRLHEKPVYDACIK